MRGLVVLAVLAGAAGPARAGCFTSDEPPARVIYATGSTLEYLSIADGVLTYRASSGFTSKLKAGVWPMGSEGDGFSMSYDWETPPPAWAEVAASKGKLEIKGKRKIGKKAVEEVSASVEVLGQEALDWEDCRYQVVRLKKTLTVGGEVESQGEILFAPDAMIVFKTVAVDAATGASTTHELKALE